MENFRERPSSARYKQASQTPHPPQGAEKRSINTFDKDTDQNIFALGDAASQMGNLDDLFAGAGFNLTQLIRDGPPPNITTTKYRVGSDGQRLQEDGAEATPESVSDDEEAPSATENPVEDKSGMVKVSTITKQMPDGRTVHTRVIQGPVRTKKRLMRITKETPEGPELLAEVEAPPDGDMSKILQFLPAALSKGETKFTEKDLENLAMPDSDTKDPDGDKIPRDTSTTPLLSNNLSQKNNNQHSIIKNRISSRKTKLSVTDSNEDETSDSRSNHAGPPSPHLKYSPSVRSSDHDQKSIGKRRISLYEDAIQVYDPAELGEIETEEMDGGGLCSFLKCLKSQGSPGKKSMPKTFCELRGRSGMMASEINTDDTLPGPQALIANYARMLYTNRPLFVETLFRAVKLDKLDVSRILCRIVLKSGMKLSHEDFREPESSATILHVALLYNHASIIDSLLRLGDSELILAKYETAEYRNQTSLHVAVANGNPELVEKLLLVLKQEERTQLINTVADGHYFKTQHSHGQLCLTAAAWAGDGQVIKILVKYGGQLAIKNLHGNTLLHSLVLQSAKHPDRIDYASLFNNVWEATGIWAEHLPYETNIPQQRELEKTQQQINVFRALLSIRNNDGNTPLALATITTSCLFRHMINLEKIFKIPQNKLGSIAWVTYDVTDITSFAHQTYNKFSVLHILAHSSQHLSRHANLDGEVDFMELEPIKAILERKWDVYRWVYITWLMIHLTYIVIFTAITSELNSCPGTNTTKPDSLESGFVEFKWFACFLILPALYIMLEITDLFGSRPYRVQFMQGQNYPIRLMKCIRSEWTITGNGPYRMVMVGFSVSCIYWFVLFASRDPHQDMALAMTLLLGWIFVLFFTRGCRVTCRFSIMIQKMFFRDLTYFLTVYGIVLIAFSFAMNAMFSYMETDDITVSMVIYDMMNVVTDLDSKQTTHRARHQMFAKLLLIFYAIFAVILLMNMLIAMMNTSYETIRVTRYNLWKQQQLSTMLMLERRLFWCKWLCAKSESDVWKKESPSDIRCYLDVTMLHTPSYRCV
ncbi:hypothetical protein CAPTEDRAFT_209645 [Capitella teleta]|uniref:Uncharacterized protein n=1 Tax=Capitella teleta TaxID=283909 RepID=R7TAL9_CAPTE|nr:hypothetical protein CAPTEDRAFT_209645 [Capitella teleta]|eukprot:ELT88527.1 hypothetical protein CAPTEDRAFT_209645 [Capitella teleta]